MPEPMLDDDSPGWEIARIQMEGDNEYSSDENIENIENNLSGGFNMNTQDFRKDLDGGLGTVWKITHNQPDNFQKLPKYRVEKTNHEINIQNTEMEQIDPETLLSSARRLSSGSGSTSEGLAPQPQRIGGLSSASSPDFRKRMMPRIDESPRRDQHQVLADMPHEILPNINDVTGWQPSTLDLPSTDLARTNRDSEQKNDDFLSWQESNSLDPGAEDESVKHYPVQDTDELPRWQSPDPLDLGPNQASTPRYPEVDINDDPRWRPSDSLNSEEDHARINHNPLQDISDFLGLLPSDSLDISGNRSSFENPHIAHELMQGISGIWEPLDCSDLTEADHGRMKEQYYAILSNLSSRSSREAGAMNRAVDITQEVEDDTTFPSNPERERECVRIMYDAILDLQHCEDNEGMQKSWRIVMQDEAKIERLAWEMMSLCENRHTHGPFPKTKRFLDRFDSFGDRFGRVVKGMKTQKALCRHLLQQEFIEELVDDPIRIQTRITNNRKVNDKKKFTIEKGRKVLGNSAKLRSIGKNGVSFDEGNESEDGESDDGKHEARIAILPLISSKKSMYKRGGEGKQKVQSGILPLSTPKQPKASRPRARKSQNKKTKLKPQN